MSRTSFPVYTPPAEVKLPTIPPVRKPVTEVRTPGNDPIPGPSSSPIKANTITVNVNVQPEPAKVAEAVEKIIASQIKQGLDDLDETEEPEDQGDTEEAGPFLGFPRYEPSAYDVRSLALREAIAFVSTLSATNSGWTSDDVVDAADDFYEFLTADE